MTKLTGAALDRAVAHAMGVKSVHDCEKWVNLTEANLKDCITEIQKHMEETGKSIALRPTKVMYIPADLEAIGLTHEDVVNMIKDTHEK